MRPYLEKPITKTAGGVAQGVGPEFKPQYHAKKKKKKRAKSVKQNSRAPDPSVGCSPSTFPHFLPVYFV
jgi:hypothetical protein